MAQNHYEPNQWPGLIHHHNSDMKGVAFTRCPTPVTEPLLYVNAEKFFFRWTWRLGGCCAMLPWCAWWWPAVWQPVGTVLTGAAVSRYHQWSASSVAGEPIHIPCKCCVTSYASYPLLLYCPLSMRTWISQFPSVLFPHLFRREPWR